MHERRPERFTAPHGRWLIRWLDEQGLTYADMGELLTPPQGRSAVSRFIQTVSPQERTLKRFLAAVRRVTPTATMEDLRGDNL